MLDKYVTSLWQVLYPVLPLTVTILVQNADKLMFSFYGRPQKTYLTSVIAYFVLATNLNATTRTTTICLPQLSKKTQSVEKHKGHNFERYPFDLANSNSWKLILASAELQGSFHC